MILYGIKTCNSCIKALSALKLRGYSVDYVDVRRDGVPKEVIESAYDAFGDKLVNKSSATWRSFTEAEKASAPLDLLQSNPTLMKRPLILRDGAMTLGWKKDVEDQYP